jgi:hypothetical protein
MNRWRHLSFVTIVCSLCGCSGDEAVRDGAADASRPGEDGAADGPRLPEGVSVVDEAPDCGTAPVLELAILTSATVFDHETGPCDALAVELWVTNTGTTSVAVDELVVGPSQFGVTAATLPWNLPAGGSAPVEFRFSSDVVTVVEGSLVLKGPQGCARVPLTGNSPADGLISASTYAVEFGELEPGQESSPKTIRFRYQGPEGGEPPSAGVPSLALNADGAFVQLGSSGGDGPFEQCEERSITVEFRAPATRGRYEGLVIYSIGAGIMTTPLYGTVVAR